MVLRSHVFAEARSRGECDWCHGEGCDDCRIVEPTGVMLELNGGRRVKFDALLRNFFDIPSDGYSDSPMTTSEAASHFGAELFEALVLAILEAAPEFKETLAGD